MIKRVVQSPALPDLPMIPVNVPPSTRKSVGFTATASLSPSEAIGYLLLTFWATSSIKRPLFVPLGVGLLELANMPQRYYRSYDNSKDNYRYICICKDYAKQSAIIQHVMQAIHEVG